MALAAQPAGAMAAAPVSKGPESDERSTPEARHEAAPDPRGGLARSKAAAAGLGESRSLQAFSSQA